MVFIHTNRKCVDLHEKNDEIFKKFEKNYHTNNSTIPFKQLTINIAEDAQGSNPPLG
jgi:hypothetical protein